MDILSLFEGRRAELSAQGAPDPWILVFDIDSTLMDTAPRNLAILRSAVAALPALEGWESSFPSASTAWNVVDGLRSQGLADEGLLGALHAFWRDRFFTDSWVIHDQPYPQVAPCLRVLKDRGFSLVYLTGRHSPGMEEGTRASFLSNELPAGRDERFFFKERFEDDDAVFKTRSCQTIASLGTVVGTVDNEPKNVNLLLRAFPAAANLWLKTITSPNPEWVDERAIAVDLRAYSMDPQA